MRYDDTKNRLAGYDVTIGGITNSVDYVFGGNTVAPDLITGVNRNGSRKISYTYDGLNRLSVRNLNNYLTEYTYLQGANTNSTTTLVSSMKNGDDILSYTYDELGNITSISKNGTVIESYTYDNLNQLKTVTRGNDVYTYSYDNGGNILSVTKNGTTTKTYTYGDSEWRDLLTAYNGNAITYDNIGNPLTYYDGSTFTWSDGRKLTNIVNGTDNISYTYDSNGLRATKTVNGTVTDYYWLDGTLYAEKTGNRYIYFHYDDNGIAYGFTVNDGTSTDDYYYIHNLQGDIIGIVDNNGTKVVEYTYDEWGKILAITGSLASTIGTLNPIRYRGYYYDAETDFYYCKARYYDPEICRWISGDSLLSGIGGSIQGYNLFAYCFNNPINMVDKTGSFPSWNEIKEKVNGAINWVDNNIIQPVVSFVKDIAEDINNYDLNNESEEKVLDSNYFSSYKGVPVIRTNGDRSGSFGAIFLTRETNNRSNPEDVLRHEYGHTKQLEQLGVVNYALCIGLPSWQQWGTGEYYSKPWEITADIYGGVQSRNHSQSNIDRGFAYLEGSKIIGPLIWVFIE